LSPAEVKILNPRKIFDLQRANQLKEIWEQNKDKIPKTSSQIVCKVGPSSVTYFARKNLSKESAKLSNFIS
jgi:hypothetical protein